MRKKSPSPKNDICENISFWRTTAYLNLKSHYKRKSIRRFRISYLKVWYSSLLLVQAEFSGSIIFEKQCILKAGAQAEVWCIDSETCNCASRVSILIIKESRIKKSFLHKKLQNFENSKNGEKTVKMAIFDSNLFHSSRNT